MSTNTGFKKSKVARSVPVDDSTLPEIAPVSNVQDALEELHDLAAGTSKGYIFAYYNGNALTGRYLELFPSIETTEAPLYTPDPLEVITIVAQTTDSDATCTIGWYDISGGIPGTLLHTTTMTATKREIENGTILFILPATGQLAIKIDSGTIKEPHIYFVAKGG